MEQPRDVGSTYGFDLVAPCGAVFVESALEGSCADGHAPRHCGQRRRGLVVSGGQSRAEEVQPVVQRDRGGQGLLGVSSKHGRQAGLGMWVRGLQVAGKEGDRAVRSFEVDAAGAVELGQGVVPAGCFGGQCNVDGDEAPLCGFAETPLVEAECVGADGAGRLVGQIGLIDVADGDVFAVLGDLEGVRAGVGDGGEVGRGVPDPFERGGRGGDQVVPDPEGADARLLCQQHGQLAPGVWTVVSSAMRMPVAAGVRHRSSLRCSGARPSRCAYPCGGMPSRRAALTLSRVRAEEVVP